MSNTSTGKPKRLRGAILSPKAYEHLIQAQKMYESAYNFGCKLSWHDLTSLSGLSRNTLLKIYSRTRGVDLGSLETLFEVFDIQLGQHDYFRPGSRLINSAEKSRVSDKSKDTPLRSYPKP